MDGRAGREELADAVNIGASGLHHAAVHTYLYGQREERPAFLASAHKSVFFALRALYELRCGENVRAKKDLLSRLTGDERELLSYGLDPPERREEPETAFARLIRWSASAMAEARRAGGEH